MRLSSTITMLIIQMMVCMIFSMHNLKRFKKLPINGSGNYISLIKALKKVDIFFMLNGSYGSSVETIEKEEIKMHPEAQAIRENFNNLQNEVKDFIVSSISEKLKSSIYTNFTFCIYIPSWNDGDACLPYLSNATYLDGDEYRRWGDNDTEPTQEAIDFQEECYSIIQSIPFELLNIVFGYNIRVKINKDGILTETADYVD